MNRLKSGLVVAGLLTLVGVARGTPTGLRLAYTSETVGEIDPCG